MGRERARGKRALRVCVCVSEKKRGVGRPAKKKRAKSEGVRENAWAGKKERLDGKRPPHEIEPMQPDLVL